MAGMEDYLEEIAKNLQLHSTFRSERNHVHSVKIVSHGIVDYSTISRCCCLYSVCVHCVCACACLCVCVCALTLAIWWRPAGRYSSCPRVVGLAS